MSRERGDHRSADCVAPTVVPGLYQLRIHLQRPVTIRVGALGLCRFPVGWYLYTGSARHGLYQRISRHLRRRKRTHWHIDYLLAVTNSVEAFVLAGTAVTECQLHARLKGGTSPVQGFGSSDCRCYSHLAHFETRPVMCLVNWESILRRRALPSILD